ncbi:unnamed protein product [Rotaria sordida]|uniref:lysozyme n=1 Tax=Rotaria sordida TaxID=392033 RepID=A0A814ZL27_9BILA|nr:unnamed protein product [Rotaria sordida]CAF1246833.1 unnamed protein product [Rotaria sordida]
MKMLANLNIPVRTVLLLIIVSSSIGSIPQCGSNPNCCRTVATLRNAGFVGSQVNIMTAIAYYESTWGTRNGPKTNKDGSTDNGLFQVNSYLWCSASGQQNDCCCPRTYEKCRRNSTLRTCSCGCNISCSQALTNDASNTQCAKTVLSLSKQGYKAWAAYNSCAAECDSYDAWKGACSSGNCCSALFPDSVCCPKADPNKHGCCPSTHPVCCPAPYQDKCCPSEYPICCGTHYCCQRSSHDAPFIQATSKVAASPKILP